MPYDTPSPPMDPVEEHRNSQSLDDGDEFVVVVDSDLSDIEAADEEGAAFVYNEPPEVFVEGVNFIKHWEPVFCCDIDSEHGLAVSGGKDDKAYVWDMRNGEAVLECTGHKDSVTHVGFNHDSSLVATGDMSGVIQVWDMQSKSRKWDFETSELKWMQWLPGKDVLLAGTVCGDAWLWHIPDGGTTMFPSFGVPCSEGRVVDEGRMVIGYDDGAVRVWDLNNAAVLQNIVGHRAHHAPITTFDCNQTGLILSGSVDGTAKLIKASDGKVLHTFQCAHVTDHPEEESDSVESVSFLSNQQSFVAATVDGLITVWDVGSHVQRLHIEQEGGVVKVICPRDSYLFFTAGLDGFVRLYDSRTGHQEAFWKVHGFEILDFCLTSDGQKIVTASEDGTCKVFNVDQS